MRQGCTSHLATRGLPERGQPRADTEIMKRPTTSEILAVIMNTVHLQFANSDDGRRLAAHDPAAVAGMERRIRNNVAHIVNTWFDEAEEDEQARCLEDPSRASAQ